MQEGDINSWAQQLQEKLRADPLFRDVTSDAQLQGLQAELIIDSDRANALGVNINALRSTLYSAFGERQVSTIYNPLNQYRVVMEAMPDYLQGPDSLSRITLVTPTGGMVPPSEAPPDGLPTQRLLVSGKAVPEVRPALRLRPPPGARWHGIGGEWHLQRLLRQRLPDPAGRGNFVQNQLEATGTARAGPDRKHELCLRHLVWSECPGGV